MCDNLWIAASTNCTGSQPPCSRAGRTVRNKVIAGDVSDAAKTEGERFSDNLGIVHSSAKSDSNFAVAA
jgi:hypothetical protein